MVILDEKYLIPPPPYATAHQTTPPPSSSGPSHWHSLAALPAHLLLKIVYMSFPQTPGKNRTSQRKTLYWLSHQLRLVNRSFYITCMHVLRSTFLPAYSSLVRAPYTSDPFPLSSSSASPAGPLETIQRETRAFDLFITLKVREDVMMDDTEFHLERKESFKDLFGLTQPRSRLEDLIRYYGVREGVVHTNKPGASSTSLPFSILSISFSTRKVGLVLTTTTRKRTVVEVARTRDETLEVAAKRLVKQLKVWLSDL